jgi:hypothetical protein
MKDYKICLSSLGRCEKQITMKYLTPKILKHSCLVVVHEERKQYENLFGDKLEIIVLPKTIKKGLSASRQWLAENIEAKHLIFLDDDLVFDKRLPDDKTKLKKCDNIEGLIELWLSWLRDGVGMVGVSSRGGNNRVKEDYVENSRIMSAYGFNRDIFIKEGMRFDRVMAMQDFDVNLQFLKNGHKNRVSYEYAHGQGSGSGAEGGCATYRTAELKRKAAFNLVRLHPDVVNIRSKISKTGWSTMEKKKGIEGTISTDVTIEWKKAYRPKRIK